MTRGKKSKDVASNIHGGRRKNKKEKVAATAKRSDSISNVTDVPTKREKSISTEKISNGEIIQNEEKELDSTTSISNGVTKYDGRENKESKDENQKDFSPEVDAAQKIMQKKNAEKSDSIPIENLIGGKKERKVLSEDVLENTSKQSVAVSELQDFANNFSLDTTNSKTHHTDASGHHLTNNGDGANDNVSVSFGDFGKEVAKNSMDDEDGDVGDANKDVKVLFGDFPGDSEGKSMDKIVHSMCALYVDGNLPNTEENMSFTPTGTDIDKNDKRKVKEWELQDMKKKVLAIVKSAGGKLSLNEVCNTFRERYGKNIRKGYRQLKVGKVLTFFENHLSDIIDIDTSKSHLAMVYEFGKAPTSSAFNDQLQKMSKKDCEKQLQKSVAHLQGSSKYTAINVDDKDSEDDDIAEQTLEDDKNGIPWKELDTNGQFDKEAIVESFNSYREFQMLHVAYVKYRIIVMFKAYGQLTLQLQHFSDLFKEMFRENFFQKSVLKYFISGDEKSTELMLNFLQTFCKDFLQISRDMTIRITQTIPSLYMKYHGQLILSVEKLEGICGNGNTLNPTPAEMMLLGHSIDSQVDVRLFSDRYGKSNIVTEFPDPSNKNLRGRERPTIGEINERVIQIRNKICREGRSVKIPEILKELCKFYNVGTVRDLHPADGRDFRKDADISAVYDIMRLQGKVNAFIQAFVTFRNICTLHELEEDLTKMESKSAFEEFKLGPLQKQLLVYELFQFPSSKESIPVITTLEVFRLLWKCLTDHRNSSIKAGKENERLTLQQFMEYLIQQNDFADPFESGVKINSIGLAIQVVRRAWHGDLHHVREISQKFSKQLCDDLEQHLMHSAKNIVGKNLYHVPGEGESLVQRISGMSLLEAFGQIYAMLQRMKYEACKTLPSTANLINFSDVTMNALSIIQKDKLMSKIFHVLLSTAPLKVLGEDDVSILTYLGFKDAIEQMVKDQQEMSAKSGKHVQKPMASPKSTVTTVTKKWLSKASEWSLNVLSNIEIQIATEINQNFASFDDLGHGSFLKFICSDKKLFELVEANFGASSNGTAHKIKKKDIIDFVNQCDEDNQKEEITKALSLQFNVKDIQKPLQNLIAQCCGSRKTTPSSIIYIEALLCGSEYQINIPTAGSADKTSVDYAVKSITAAPYLTDLLEWTRWDVLFAHKLGELNNFLLENFDPKEADFSFLEEGRNKIIKVKRECSIDDLLRALKELDSLKTSTCLISIFMSRGHLNNVPMALLSNHFQNVFLETSADVNKSQDLLNFCLQCFGYISFGLLCCIITKLFLDPLSQIHGRLIIPQLLLDACHGNHRHRRILHALGLHMSMSEWIADFETEIDTPTAEADEQKVEDVENASADQSEISMPDLRMEQDNTSSQIENKSAPVDNNVGKNSTLDITKADDSSSLKESTPDVVLDAVAVSNVVSSTECSIEEEDDQNIDDAESFLIDQCKEFIETIRKEQFGVGMQFGEEEQKLIEIHREREGRSLHRLSRELYTKDSHFVLELIQNADDNEYPQHFMTSNAVERPTVAFIVEDDMITILNNEVGFMEKNVKALCDVGKSTKGIHRKGYIGQKGIGFKSVFRVTDSPEIHSNGYHIKFDASSGPNGYILPQWVEGWHDIEYAPAGTNIPFSWTTKIILPLKKEMQHTKLTSRFHDIHPSLLMFLNRLHTIIIDDKVSDSVKIMSKEQVDKNLIELSQNQETTLWFVRNEEIPIDVREDVKTTDISVAFPLCEIEQKMLPVQPVFAFLPLRSYGFKFIMQADFEVPSSREDIDKDSPWNQYILQHLPSLVVNAFHSFKNHSHFTGLNGIVEYFKFMDLEDHVIGIFKQVARQIMKSLQREACLPIQAKPSDMYEWALPNSVVISTQKDNDVIPPDMLHDQLGLYYLHTDIRSKIADSVMSALGVTKLSLKQLVDIAKTTVRKFNDLHQNEAHPIAMHEWIGKWLFAVHSIMQEKCDYSETTLEMLKTLKIFALSDGRLVSLKDEVVFFPVESSIKNRKANKTLMLIENSLCFLSRALTSNMDQVQQLQVIRLLKNLGVKAMSPSDLIHNFIIPLFKTGEWKDKPEDVLVACVKYLRQQFTLDPNLFEISDISGHIALLTSKGFKLPSNEVIYLTPEYGNPLNLRKILKACDWTMISNEYLSTSNAPAEKKSWQDFFVALGLQTFCDIRRHVQTLHKTDLVGSVWEKYSETWEETEDETYVIHDLICPEFDALLLSGNKEQINTFATTLDKKWTECFKKYDLTKPTCVVKNTREETIEQTFSSVFLKMRTSQWICSAGSGLTFHVPRELYKATEEIFVLLDDKVRYISNQFRDKDFICTLGAKQYIDFEDVVIEFNKWKKESLFTTTYVHTQNIYKYFQERVLRAPGVFKELLDEPFFFLLTGHCSQQLMDRSVAEGTFLHKKDVCWEDPSGIITRGVDSMFQKRVLKGYYPDAMKNFFVHILGVDLYPSTSEYLSIVSNISHTTTLPDKAACQKIFSLFAVLGQKSIMNEDAADKLKDWSLPNAMKERYSLYYDLREFINPAVIEESSSSLEEKIFPTTSNRFASRAEMPLLVFDKSLARVYLKCEELPLILFDDVVFMLRKTHLKRHEEREMERNVIKILLFFKSCGLPTLNDVALQPEVITVGMKKGCRKWEQVLHDIAPYVQRYLASKQVEIYKRLQQRGFAKYLKNSTFFEVTSLEVIYRLTDRSNVNIKLPKVSNVEDADNKRARIYVTTEYVDDKKKHDQILGELTELFVGKSGQLNEDLLEFVLFLNSVSNKESHLQRKKIPHLPTDDLLWSFPEPVKEAPPPPKPAPAVVVAPVPKDEGEQRLTCWPPRKPGGSGFKTKPDSVRKEEQEILEKWQPPAAPEDETVKKECVVEEPVNQAGMQSRSSKQLISQPDIETVQPVDVDAPNSTSSGQTGDDVKRTDGLKRKRHESETFTREVIGDNTEVKPTTKKPFSPVQNEMGAGIVVTNVSIENPPRQEIVIDNSATKAFDARLIPRYDLLQQYEDLPISIDVEKGEVSLNTYMEDKLSDPNNPIGQIGEQLVYVHLRQHYKSEIDSGNVTISWLNESGETGEPYDLKITYADHLKARPVYVEVKTTYMDERKEFEISSQQLKFAFEQGPCFHLYRVSGISNKHELKMKRLVNLSTYMDNKSVKLFMIL